MTYGPLWLRLFATFAFVVGVIDHAYRAYVERSLYHTAFTLLFAALLAAYLTGMRRDALKEKF